MFACVHGFKQIQKSLTWLQLKGFFDTFRPPKILAYGMLIMRSLGSLHTRMQIMRGVELNEKVQVVLVTF